MGRKSCERCIPISPRPNQENDPEFLAYYDIINESSIAPTRYLDDYLMQLRENGLDEAAINRVSEQACTFAIRMLKNI